MGLSWGTSRPWLSTTRTSAPRTGQPAEADGEQALAVVGEIVRALGAGCADDGRGLGHAVADGDAGVGEEGFELRDEFGGRGGAAEHDVFEAGEIVLRSVGAGEQSGGHGGDEDDVGDALLLDEAEDGGAGRSDGA